MSRAGLIADWVLYYLQAGSALGSTGDGEKGLIGLLAFCAITFVPMFWARHVYHEESYYGDGHLGLI